MSLENHRLNLEEGMGTIYDKIENNTPSLTPSPCGLSGDNCPCCEGYNLICSEDSTCIWKPPTPPPTPVPMYVCRAPDYKCIKAFPGDYSNISDCNEFCIKPTPAPTYLPKYIKSGRWCGPSKDTACNPIWDTSNMESCSFAIDCDGEECFDCTNYIPITTPEAIYKKNICDLSYNDVCIIKSAITNTNILNDYIICDCPLDLECTKIFNKDKFPFGICKKKSQ